MNSDLLNGNDWDVFAIAGPSGVGKSSVNYPLARHFDVAMVEIDDLVHAVQALTKPADQPVIHYWQTHPQAVELPPERILETLLHFSRAMAPAIRSVIENHIETEMPIVLDGDYLLPELVAEFGDRVKAVFLVEEDKEQILRNYLAREPQEGAQRKRAQVSRLFGRWLWADCERLGVPVIAARPWGTAIERVIATATTQPIGYDGH